MPDVRGGCGVLPLPAHAARRRASRPETLEASRKGFDGVLRENPVRSGSFAEALREMVNRSPRLLVVLEDLRNRRSAIDDCENWVPQDDPAHGTPTPPESKPSKPDLPPRSQSPTTLAGDRTRQSPTSWNFATTVSHPPTSQNATPCNTVASVATDCNTAVTESYPRTPEPATACSDHPTARLVLTPQDATVCSALSSTPQEDQPQVRAESELQSVERKLELLRSTSTG
jgi:hypothetical protein